MEKIVTVQPNIELLEMDVMVSSCNKIGTRIVSISCKDMPIYAEVKKFGLDMRLGKLLDPTYSVCVESDDTVEFLKEGDVIQFYADDTSKIEEKPIRCDFKVEVIDDAQP